MKYLHFRSGREQATERLDEALSSRSMTDEEAFSFAGFDSQNAERGGYSGYSYWRSTLRAFFQNRAAVFFLIVMVAVLIFTFIQPYQIGRAHV